jgi:hypothetical protein
MPAGGTLKVRLWACLIVGFDAGEIVMRVELYVKERGEKMVDVVHAQEI